MFHLLSGSSCRPDDIVVDNYCCCCCFSCCEKFKRSEARSGVGRVVRCSIYYPAVLAAWMTSFLMNIVVVVVVDDVVFVRSSRDPKPGPGWGG